MFISTLMSNSALPICATNYIRGSPMSENISFRWGIPLLDEGITQIPNYFFDVYSEAGIKRHEFLLVLHLSRYKYERQGSIACPAMRTLSEQMGYKTSRALQQVLADLEARGLLQRHYRDGKSTIYDFSGFSELMRQTKQLGGASKCTMHANAPLVSESDDKGVHPAAHEEEQVNCKQEKEEETHEQELLPEDKAFIDELEEQARNAPPRKSVGAEQRIIDTRQASARGHARRAASNNNIAALPSFEAALQPYGDNAPALRSLQHQIDINFGLMPDWTNKKQVKSWVSGLQEVWIASHEDQDVIIEAGKYLREKAFPIADPRSLTKMARSIAAERATAHGSPEVQARKEYR